MRWPSYARPAPVDMTASPYISLALSIALGVVGQILLKMGAKNAHTIVELFVNFNTYIVIGLIVYFISALLYISALTHIRLSVAFPAVSISYFAVAYLAHLIWDEPFGWPQIVGLVLIGVGLAMIARQPML